MPDTVFVLHHVAHEDQDEEDSKLIGIYSSRAAVDSAVARLRSQPGFRDYPVGFGVDEYQVDKDQWTEGFVTMINILVPSVGKVGANQCTTSWQRLPDLHLGRSQLFSVRG